MYISIDKPTLLALALSVASSSVEAAANINWDGLSTQLSTPDALQVADVNAWFDQCVRPFDLSSAESQESVAYATAAPGGGSVSNYDLFKQPSGLCMQTLSCAFADCKGIYYDTYAPAFGTTVVGFVASDSEALAATNYSWYPVVPKMDATSAALGENGELPEAVVHPIHVGDVAATIKFASENDIGISVKTSGHNWMGSSTRKGTILLNLTKLRKYALPETLSEAIFECDNVLSDLSTDASPSALIMACDLSVARGKPALIRFGGGQIVDEGVRTIEAWNDSGRGPYLATIGAAGTVSAVGGWLASGGLAGTFGMRKHGIGVDQVLHVEMVLPDGRFVRFGPTSWEMPEGQQLYPTTTTVTGYCNDGDLTNEASWNWVQCDNEPNFADLWYAIRGGGGGSYGVLTSVYYQLSDNASGMQVVDLDPAPFIADPDLSDDDKVATIVLLQEYIFLFMYSPSKIGVPVSVSNSCSAPDFPVLICYDGAGQVFADGWSKYGNSTTLLPVIEPRSYSEFMGSLLGVVSDNIPDFPRGNAVFLSSVNPIVFPVDVIQNKFEQFFSLWAPCYIRTVFGVEYCLSNGGAPYMYGGGIQFSSDGMNAYPTHRRNGAFHIQVVNETVREEFKKLFWDDDGASDTFPGVYCHNHLWPTASTLKSNWLKECNTLAGDVIGEGDCMSLQEAAFGTENLHRLEIIHSKIDPKRMFHTSDGPGYAEDEGGTVPENPSEDEPPVGGTGVEEGSNIASYLTGGRALTSILSVWAVNAFFV